VGQVALGWWISVRDCESGTGGGLCMIRSAGWISGRVA